MVSDQIPEASLVFSTETFDGTLIVFCGLDGAGKTTLLDAVEERLTAEGLQLFRTKQPTDAVRNSALFKSVMYTQRYSETIEYRAHSLITVSDRIQHSLRVILPELRRGKVCLSDRYFFSAVANLRARGYHKDRWVYELGNLLPRPDIAFFCIPPFKLIQDRLGARQAERTRYYDVDFNKRLQDEFIHLARVFPRAVVLDTSEPFNRTRDCAIAHALQVIRGKAPRVSRVDA